MGKTLLLVELKGYRNRKIRPLQNRNPLYHQVPWPIRCEKQKRG